jgi:hypothetical protein
LLDRREERRSAEKALTGGGEVSQKRGKKEVEVEKR